jgi:hypothetical protein
MPRDAGDRSPASVPPTTPGGRRAERAGRLSPCGVSAMPFPPATEQAGIVSWRETVPHWRDDVNAGGHPGMPRAGAVHGGPRPGVGREAIRAVMPGEAGSGATPGSMARHPAPGSSRHGADPFTPATGPRASRGVVRRSVLRGDRGSMIRARRHGPRRGTSRIRATRAPVPWWHISYVRSNRSTIAPGVKPVADSKAPVQPPR